MKLSPVWQILASRAPWSNGVADPFALNVWLRYEKWCSIGGEALVAGSDPITRRKPRFSGQCHLAVF
jgi:hypothetical protein